MLKSRPVSFRATEGKDPIFLAINHTPVPCTAEQMKTNGKSIPIKFTILQPLCAGFGAAPYSSRDKTQKDPNTAKYSQMVWKDSQCIMKMWPFQKSSVVGDKGPIVDNPFTIELGTTLTLFVDLKRIKEDQKHDRPCLPPLIESIPQFTLCQLTLSPKNHEAVEKGSSVKISMVRIHSSSMYSIWPSIARMPGTLQDARLAQMEKFTLYPGLAKDIDVKDVPFFVHVPRTATIDDSDPDPKIMFWGGDEPIIVPAEVLQQYTNTKRLDLAISLLNVAISADSLYLMIFSNDYWMKNGSVYKGVPLIDTEHLLEYAFPGTTSDTRYTVTNEGNTYKLMVEVGSEPQSIENGPEPFLKDLVLCGRDTELKEAYPLSFHLAGDCMSVPNICKAFINVSRNVDLSTKRKRFATVCD